MVASWLTASFCSTPTKATFAPTLSPAPTQLAARATSPSALRTFVVLKPRRARLTSTSSSISSNSSTASEDEDEFDDDDVDSDTESSDQTTMAYESYAAVTSRYNNSSTRNGGSPRELRWSDLNRSSGSRGPRIEITKLLTTKTSQHARRRQQRRAGTCMDNVAANSDNALLESHALELCLEFLDAESLVASSLVCHEFRRVVTNAKRLLLALYSQQWRSAAAAPLTGAFLALPFAAQLAMVERRNDTAPYTLASRSSVTTTTNERTLVLQNDSMLRSFASGAVESFRGVEPLPVLPCAAALGQQLAYFEVSLQGCGSVGVASLSDAASRASYGFGSSEHVGWKPVSYGYHSNDGDFVYNDGSAAYGGAWTPLGPAWGSTDGAADAPTFVVGCGIDYAARALFFTLNGTLVGLAPVAILKGTYAAAVSLHAFGDTATLNVGSAPFCFDIEAFCASR